MLLFAIRPSFSSSSWSTYDLTAIKTTARPTSGLTRALCSLLPMRKKRPAHRLQALLLYKDWQSESSALFPHTRYTKYIPGRYIGPLTFVRVRKFFDEFEFDRPLQYKDLMTAKNTNELEGDLMEICFVKLEINVYKNMRHLILYYFYLSILSCIGLNIN